MSRTIAWIKNKKNKFRGVARLKIFKSRDKDKKREITKDSFVFEHKKFKNKKQKIKKREKNKAINSVVG